MKIYLISVLLVLCCLSVFSQERFLQYKSKDSINGQPKVTGSLGVNLKLNGYFDFYGGLQNSETFNVGAINVFGTDDSGSLKVDLYQTQIKMESGYITNKGEQINAVVEFDFWGGNGHMRLRKAYVASDNWLIGQNWVVYGDSELWPNIMEWEGPPSGVWVRSPQITYTNTLKNKDWQYYLSFATPIIDYNAYGELEPLINEANQTTPDFMVAVKYKKNWGHLKLSAVLRNINYIYINEDDNFIGYGLSFSGIYKKYRNNFQFQIVGGKGVSAYITSVQGFGFDGYPTINNEVVSTPSIGGWASYELYFTEKLHSNFVIGFTEFYLDEMNRVIVKAEENNDFAIANGHYKSSNYYGIFNLMYDPFERMIIGAELNYGHKKIDFDGTVEDNYIDDNQARDALRLSFGVMYSF